MPRRGAIVMQWSTSALDPGAVSRCSGAWSFDSTPKSTARPISRNGSDSISPTVREKTRRASGLKLFPAPEFLSSQRSFSRKWYATFQGK